MVETKGPSGDASQSTKPHPDSETAGTRPPAGNPVEQPSSPHPFGMTIYDFICFVPQKLWSLKGKGWILVPVVLVLAGAAIFLLTFGVPCREPNAARPCTCSDGSQGSQRCEWFCGWSRCACGTVPTCTVGYDDDAVVGGQSRCRSRSDLATFPSELPLANTRQEWGSFNDNKWLGHSTIWYETLPHADPKGDHFFRVHFVLDRGPRARTPDAYVGVYLELNPPRGTADLSAYSGLHFTARHQPWPPGVVLLVHLATPVVPGQAYHEYDCSSQSQSRSDEFHDIHLPFKKFEQPGWYTGDPARFDATRVTHVAFVVKGVARGEPFEGYVDLDDVGLYGPVE